MHPSVLEGVRRRAGRRLRAFTDRHPAIIEPSSRGRTANTTSCSRRGGGFRRRPAPKLQIPEDHLGRRRAGCRAAAEVRRRDPRRIKASSSARWMIPWSMTVSSLLEHDEQDELKIRAPLLAGLLHRGCCTWRRPVRATSEYSWRRHASFRHRRALDTQWRSRTNDTDVAVGVHGLVVAVGGRRRRRRSGRLIGSAVTGSDSALIPPAHGGGGRACGSTREGPPRRSGRVRRRRRGRGCAHA